MNNSKRLIVKDQLSRREFLRAVGLASASAGVTLLLNSCAPAATATPAPAEVSLGMVDTTIYKKDPPWHIGRSGMGEVNSGR
jgi:hypothetical protein